MADERTFETTINLGGLIIPVEAEFTVTSWGAPGSGFSMTGPGEPDESPEFYITRVVAKDTGLDLTAACDRKVNEPKLYFALQKDDGQDPIRTALFGLRSDPAWIRPEPPKFLPYQTKIINGAATILEAIEAEIMMDADALTLPDDDDWDPRDWE